MESRFAHRRERDASVSMLRVKMSRRKSQSQKENRANLVNQRRQLEKISEQDISCLDANMTVSSHEEDSHKGVKPAKNKAVEERAKQLDRWRERKALEKEKQKREKERKGVFKTGVYHAKDTLVITSVPSTLIKPKEARPIVAPPQSSGRVTRSMKQQLQKPLKIQNVNTTGIKGKPEVEKSTKTRGAQTRNKAVIEPVRASTRSATAVKNKQNNKPADLRTTRSRGSADTVLPAPGRSMPAENASSATEVDLAQSDLLKEPEEDKMVVEPAQDPSSFAPDGFMFEAPTGLSSFKFEPLTPRSANAFPMPSPSLPVETKHDVPYFRTELTNETEKLTTLCTSWEVKVEDESIPVEFRDRMRTAVGYARLLMKGRFNQFHGLVDDCELQRGEKITTPTDLQGFWDMVFYQVEDVNKKFEALVEAEARGWKEENEKSTRQRNMKKKNTNDVEQHPSPPASEGSDLMSEDGPSAAAEPAKILISVAPDGPELKNLSSTPAEEFQTPRRARLPPCDEPLRESSEVSHQSPSNPDDGLESQHDVPYFRSQIITETENLTFLSAQWQLKVDDESIPEEMRDRMRTAVGQARLLMKERFGQFGGLVDDCELQRGEKITTCSDLQGFWDMVYYQVEDVNKKFQALKDTEARGWQEEHKSPPRQRKIVKKPAAVTQKAAGTKAAARSRLAAIKAAMKAKQLAAEVEAATSSSAVPQDEAPVSCEEAASAQSPAKASCSVRRSHRVSAAVAPQDSPRSSLLTPRRRTLRSLAPVPTLESLCAAQRSEAESLPEEVPLLADVTVETKEAASTDPCLSAAETTATSPTKILFTPAGPGPTESEKSGCQTPNSSVVEDAPGLDFERYLLPSSRCSLTPKKVASPLSLDVEMESPSHPEDAPSQQEAAPQQQVLPLMFPLQSPVPLVNSADASLLLFTPNLKDRIRESVCPSDLMVFTPPL